MEFPQQKGFFFSSLLFLLIGGISSTLLTEKGRESIVLDSNHQLLGTFDVFLDKEDLFYSASDQVFQKLMKKPDDEKEKSSHGLEEQSTVKFTRSRSSGGNRNSSDEKQRRRPVRRFKVNPYKITEPTDEKPKSNGSRIVRIRKFKRKPAETLSTAQPLQPIERKPMSEKPTSTQPTPNPVPHIRVINNEQRRQKRKKSKGREKSPKSLIPATNGRIFQPPEELSVPKSFDNAYKGLRLSKLTENSETSHSDKPINFRSSQSVSIRAETNPPRLQNNSLPLKNNLPPLPNNPAGTKEIISKVPDSSEDNNPNSYTPVLPGTFAKLEKTIKSQEVNNKQDEINKEIHTTAVPKLVHPLNFPEVRVPQQYYHHPYTVIPPQEFQRSMNFLQAPPHDPNAAVYGNMPQYYSPGIQQPQPNMPNHPMFYSPHLSADHSYFANSQNNAPYSGWQDYGLPGLRHSPHLTALRRSIWDEDIAESKSDSDEPVTSFSIPKFDIPSVDYTHDGCQTKIKEIKEVPFSDIPHHVSHRRQKRKVKSVILTRECFFPKGFPVEEKETEKSYAQKTIKTSEGTPKESEVHEAKASYPQVTEESSENKDTLTVSETRNADTDNVVQFLKSSGNENLPKFKEPYFHLQHGYVFDE